MRLRTLAVLTVLSSLACGGGGEGSASTTETAPSDYSDVQGYWYGDWGTVKFTDNQGTYTDTYGSSPGKIEVTRLSDRAFEGTWGESEDRKGTLSFTLSKDGEKIHGSFDAIPSAAMAGEANSGTISWHR